MSDILTPEQLASIRRRITNSRKTAAIFGTWYADDASALLSENEALRARVAELEQENSEMSCMLAEPPERLVRITELERQLADAREDSARLDWRETQVPDGFQWAVGRLDSGCVTIHPVRRGYDLQGHYLLFETYREAVDTSRAQKQENA